MRVSERNFFVLFDGTKKMTKIRSHDVVNKEQADVVVAQEQRSEDNLKIFLSRIPTLFDEASVKRVLEESLGADTVVHVALCSNDASTTENIQAKTISASKSDDRFADRPNKKAEKKTVAKENAAKHHRGYGFVTLQSVAVVQRAVNELKTVRGGAKRNSTRMHTLYIGPCLTDEQKESSAFESSKKTAVCFLWSAGRCPYGDDSCKFAHTGPGGLLETSPAVTTSKKLKKLKKCRDYRKKGKCKLGEYCPFSHDFEISKKLSVAAEDHHRPDSEKDCIDWKTKGNCRKLSKNLPCPYKHDPVKQKKKRKHQDDDATPVRSNKQKQPLTVRVFGLNYETTEATIRNLFADCGGPIVSVDFPVFPDSGRSKGYCCVTFQSPKAVERAVLQLNGTELDGRWLSVQAGKMYLEDWEQHHADRACGGGGGEDEEPKSKRTKSRSKD